MGWAAETRLCPRRIGRVSMRLGFGRDVAWLVVRDDGRGPSAVPSASELLAAGKLGLVGMEERARLSGADFEVRPSPRGGTSIVVSVPIEVKKGVA